MAAEAETESARAAGPSGQADGAAGTAPRASPVASKPAWESAETRYSFLVAVSAAVFAADQATKAVVKANMQMGEVIPLIPPYLDLHLITNRGVAFGLFTRFGDAFIPIALVIMAVIVTYYRTLKGRRLLLRTALALQLGGALGNLLDRLRYGAVVDFLDFHIDAINFHWPIFNLADSAIVLGVGILLWCLTFQQE